MTDKPSKLEESLDLCIAEITKGLGVNASRSDKAVGLAAVGVVQGSLSVLILHFEASLIQNQDSSTPDTSQDVKDARCYGDGVGIAGSPFIRPSAEELNRDLEEEDEDIPETRGRNIFMKTRQTGRDVKEKV